MPPQEATVDFSEDSLSGMIRVKATGATIVLGTTLVEARANERPEMHVKFDYDFSLGRHEVTCGEFNALMKPATGLSLDCESDEIPATNVTYYDAVLFANERSKAEGFDTAYTYMVASFDAEKHCTNLEGFAYRSEDNAFRCRPRRSGCSSLVWTGIPKIAGMPKIRTTSCTRFVERMLQTSFVTWPEMRWNG